MSCKHPIYAVVTGTNENGKKILHFPYGFNSHLPGDNLTPIDVSDLKKTYGSDNVIAIPCGHCLSCKLDYSKNWSNRCVLESLSYENNCFVTLTFNDESLLNLKDDFKSILQKFLKRLRRSLDYPIRYFACFERGARSNRPHYHLIIFNYWPSDARLINNHTESKELEKIWSYGHVVVGDVTPASCSYVAQYCTKKIYSNKTDEFVLMSRKPGIGYNYFIENFKKIYDYNSIPLLGRSVAIPRYFDKCLEKIDLGLLSESKEVRLDKSKTYLLDRLRSQKLGDVEILNLQDGEHAERVFNAKKGGKKL